LEGALDLAIGGYQVALLLEVAGEVVAGDRLLPPVARLNRELEELYDPLAEVPDADVTEHQAGGAPSEDPQPRILRLVGQVDGELGVTQCLGIRAGEEAELRLQRGHLGARRAIGALGM